MCQYLGSRETSLTFKEQGSHNCSIDLMQGDGLSRAKGVHLKSAYFSCSLALRLLNKLCKLPPFCSMLRHAAWILTLFCLTCTCKEKLIPKLFSCSLANSPVTVSDGVFRSHPESGNLPKPMLAFLMVSAKQKPPLNSPVPSSLLLQKPFRFSIQIFTQDIIGAVNIKCNSLDCSSAEVGYHSFCGLG